MYYISKKTSLLILAITSLVCSRTLFFFFNDPEGPNLLVVTIMAAIIYALSLAVYFFKKFPTTGLKRLLLTVLIQIVIVVGFYFGLK